MPATLEPTYINLVLDLGGVVISYSPKGNSVLPPRTIKRIFGSLHWHEYERGNLTQEECYALVAKEFDLEDGAWGEAMDQMESTLTSNLEFIDAIRDLKTTYPRLRVHAFSNVSEPDFEKLEPIVKEWGIFDSVTTSATVGSRKPDFDSYRRLLERLNMEASSSIFVDDLPENIVNAHSLGFHGVLFRETTAVVTQLHNLLGDPVARGMDFLRRHSKNLFCETDGGVIVKDNFCQLLILQCIGDKDMVTLENDGDCWQFFIGEKLFTNESFPEDSDTTALALVVVDTPSSQKEAAMERIMSYQTPDGLPELYFDHMRPRWCPHISASILRFFFLNGQGHRQRANLEHMCRILKSEAFEFETRYYYQSDWLFYHLADLCGKSSDPELDELRGLLTTRLEERTGCDKDVLGAAMRVLAAQSLGLTNRRDLKTLLATQQLDGGWEFVWMWRYGTVNVRIGSRGVPTAMAVKAIQNAVGGYKTTK